MSTNFYAVDKCECCQREDRTFVGKSSAGWRFLTHTGFASDWKEFIDAVFETEIVDEYGKRWNHLEFAQYVEGKAEPNPDTGVERLSAVAVDASVAPARFEPSEQMPLGGSVGEGVKDGPIDVLFGDNSDESRWS